MSLQWSGYWVISQSSHSVVITHNYRYTLHMPCELSFFWRAVMPHKRGHFPKHQNIDTVNYLKKYRLACRKPCLSTLLELISIIKFLLSFSNQHQITHINWHKKDHKENQAVGISTIGTQWDQTQTGKMAPYMKGVLKKFIFLFYLVGLYRMTTRLMIRRRTQTYSDQGPHIFHMMRAAPPLPP